MYVGIREAKVHLSSLLKKVHEGQDIIITDHGKPVGKLTRISDEELPLYHRITAMEQSGLIQPQVKEYKKLPPPLPVEVDVQTLLQEERNRD